MDGRRLAGPENQMTGEWTDDACHIRADNQSAII